LFLLGFDHAFVHPIYLLEKIIKMNQTIEKRKLLIPFIILGARPTSTPSPKRDQLVSLHKPGERMHNKIECLNNKSYKNTSTKMQ